MEITISTSAAGPAAVRNSLGGLYMAQSEREARIYADGMRAGYNAAANRLGYCPEPDIQPHAGRIAGAERDERPLRAGDFAIVAEPVNFHELGEVVLVRSVDPGDWLVFEGKPGHYNRAPFRRATPAEVYERLNRPPTVHPATRSEDGRIYWWKSDSLFHAQREGDAEFHTSTDLPDALAQAGYEEGRFALVEGAPPESGE